MALIDNQICIPRAPFNDLVPTRALENLDHDLAIGFGGMQLPATEATDIANLWLSNPMTDQTSFCPWSKKPRNR